MTDIRTQILNADDFETEIVDVPEWGVKVTVKSLTIAEQTELTDAVRKRTGKSDGEYQIDKRKFAPQLLIRTVIDDDGNPVFEQADADALSKKSGKAVARIVKVASRLAGLADDQVEETIEELKGTASDDSS
jgi:hypothetical protein